MPRFAFALLLLPLLAVAAPVPKRAKTLAEVYGEVTNPDGQCKCEMDRGGTLTVTVPNTHDSVPLSNVIYRRPLVAKSVEGDFVVTTRVTLTLPAAGRTVHPKEPPTATAGVSVFSQQNGERSTFCVMGMATGLWTEGKWQMAWSEHRWCPRGGGGGRADSDAKVGSPVYLRITRRRDQVTLERSTDGAKWEATKGSTTLAGTVSVGPVAFQCTDREFVATFDEYELKALPTDEKK